MRFPLEGRRARRDEEQRRGAEGGRTQSPAPEIPTEKKKRTRRPEQGDVRWLQAAEFAALPAQFRTKSALGLEGSAPADKRPVPFPRVLRERWFLGTARGEELAKGEKDWGRLLKKNRTLAVNSVTGRDAQGQKVAVAGPPSKVEELVALLARRADTQGGIGERE